MKIKQISIQKQTCDRAVTQIRGHSIYQDSLSSSDMLSRHAVPVFVLLDEDHAVGAAMENLTLGGA